MKIRLVVRVRPFGTPDAVNIYPLLGHRDVDKYPFAVQYHEARYFRTTIGLFYIAGHKPFIGPAKVRRLFAVHFHKPKHPGERLVYRFGRLIGRARRDTSQRRYHGYDASNCVATHGLGLSW